MKISMFLELLQETLEINNIELKIDSKLNSIPQYDSLGIMSIVALIDENFNKRFKAQEFEKIATVKELMELIGIENFEE
jgi:acyl carrier protein